VPTGKAEAADLVGLGVVVVEAVTLLSPDANLEYAKKGWDGVVRPGWLRAGAGRYLLPEVFGGQARREDFPQ
jgi:hypothetical protein